jgi:hypothetical protein
MAQAAGRGKRWRPKRWMPPEGFPTFRRATKPDWRHFRNFRKRFGDRGEMYRDAMVQPWHILRGSNRRWEEMKPGADEC